MNAKGMNVLEAHVEKIVLGVAAAGALYLGFLAFQPVYIDSNSKVTVDRVEEELSTLIDTLKKTEDVNKRITITTAGTDDYVKRYQDLIKNQPLATDLVTAMVPQMGPLNLPVSNDGGPGPVATFAAVTPDAAAPEFVTAEAWQQPVAAVTLPAPGTPVAPPVPGTSLPMRDQNGVVITGWIPVGKMLAQLAAQKDKARLPDSVGNNYQRAAVHRIEVQRRVLSGTGWSEWKDAAPAKGSVAPSPIDWAAVTEVLPELDRADLEYKQIAIPDFYLDAQGLPILPPNLTKAPPKPVSDRIKQLQDEINKAKNIIVTGQPGLTGIPGVPVPPPTPVDAAATPLVTDPLTLRAQPLIPFCFWDENVEADHQYQYRVRVVYVNPTYHWQYGLKDAKMKDIPTLASAWVAVNTPVVVNADVAFYVMGSSGRGNIRTADIRLFKRTAGKWYRTQWDAQVGMSIAGQVPLIDHTPRVNIEVDTGYTVVDVSGTGNETRAVLLNPSGELVTREASVDRSEPQNDKLFKTAVQLTPVAPATTRPVPGPGPSPSPGAAPAGRGGRLPAPEGSD